MVCYPATCGGLGEGQVPGTASALVGLGMKEEKEMEDKVEVGLE